MQLADRNTLLTLFALLLLVLAPTAWSSDWTSLTKDKALADFNEQDLQDYLKTVTALLDAPQPAAPVEWSNPKTGVGARLEVIGEPRVAGFDECRRVRTNVYSAKHKPTTRTWTACRASDGEWSLTKGS
jgi:surface antigen